MESLHGRIHGVSQIYLAILGIRHILAHFKQTKKLPAEAGNGLPLYAVSRQGGTL